MPIEIRELNIKISVSQNQQEQGSDRAPNAGGQAMPDKDELIAECLEQVSEMLKNKRER